jgi:hypothetical protein
VRKSNFESENEVCNFETLCSPWEHIVNRDESGRWLSGCIISRSHLSTRPHHDTSKDLLCLKNSPIPESQIRLPKICTPGSTLSLPPSLFLTNPPICSALKPKGVRNRLWNSTPIFTLNRLLLNGWVKPRNNLVWNFKSVLLRELLLLRELSVGRLGGSELVRLVPGEMEQDRGWLVSK